MVDVEATALIGRARRRDGRQLVLYDGLCGLCHRTVRFLLARDRRRRLTFAPLQGEAAERVRGRRPEVAGADSVVFVRDEGTADERVFLRSRAAVELLATIGGFWRAASWALRTVPPPLRDAAYDLVARRRYGWFGRLDACPLPAPDDRSRFID